MPLLTELRVFLDHIRGGPPPKSPAPEAALIVQRNRDPCHGRARPSMTDTDYTTARQLRAPRRFTVLLAVA
jgi:hypothetical protein